MRVGARGEEGRKTHSQIKCHGLYELWMDRGANEFRVIWGQSPAVKITERKASTEKSVCPFSILLFIVRTKTPSHALSTPQSRHDNNSSGQKRCRSVSSSWRESSMNPHNDSTGRVDSRVGNEMTHKAAASQHETDIFSQIVRVIRGSAHTHSSTCNYKIIGHFHAIAEASTRNSALKMIIILFVWTCSEKNSTCWAEGNFSSLLENYTHLILLKSLTIAFFVEPSLALFRIESWCSTR